MTESMKLLGLYLANVFVIAIPFAIFEIWLERFKSGWGGEFHNQYWGKTVRKNFGLQVYTRYHQIAFFRVLPSILLVEFLMFWIYAGSGFWVFDIAGVKIVPIMFLLSVWIGVTLIEDFLWFALNWHHRGALKRLLSGDVSWHVGWVNLTKSIKLPRKYFEFMIVVFILLVAQFILAYLI